MSVTNVRLLVTPAAVLDPAFRVTPGGIVMGPVHHAALLVPLVLTEHAHLVALLQGNAGSEIDLRTPASVTGVEEGWIPGPRPVVAASPNPFRSTTHIAFTLPEDGLVKLSVYDVAGRRVAVVADDHLPARRGRASGRHAPPR